MPGRLQGTLLTCPVDYCPAGVQGTVLGITVDLSALPYLLRLFPSPHRAGVPGWLVPVDSDCAGQRRAISRGSVHPRSETRVEFGGGALFLLGQAFRSERRAGVGSEAFRSERQARVRSGRRSSLARPSGRKLVHPFVLLLGFWASPGVACRS